MKKEKKKCRWCGQKKYFTVAEANMIKSAMLSFQNELLYPHDEPIITHAKYQILLLKSNYKFKKASKYDYANFVQKMMKKIDRITNYL